MDNKDVDNAQLPNNTVETPNNSENVSETNVISETVVDADVNNVIEQSNNDVSSIEEVSVTADTTDFNNLNESEVSDSSVFNKPEKETTVTGMKEGVDYSNQKKGFPFFMVFVFILLIIFAFFVDDIVDYVKEYFSKKDDNTEEVVSKDDESEEDETDEPTVKNLDLNTIKTALDTSFYKTDFESLNNVVLNSSVKDNHLIITTSNYLSVAGATTLSVDYSLENDVMMTTCDVKTSQYGLDISLLLIKVVAQLQGVNDKKLNAFVDEHKFDLTIDKGFALSHSEDGNNTYMIATNVKLDVAE